MNSSSFVTAHRRGWVILCLVLALTATVRPAAGQFTTGIPTAMPSPLNEGGAYAYPWLTADQLTMYFGSTRPGSGATSDLWVTTRASLDSPWEKPESLGPNINDPDLFDLGPTLTGDGLN